MAASLPIAACADLTILVSGFSRFPGAPVNPTEDLVLALPERLESGEALARIVLPVEWDASWPALERAIRATRPRAVLMLGLAARSEGVRVELTATNHRDVNAADAAGRTPSGAVIAEDGPASIAARLPFAALVVALREAGTAPEWSRNAGAYLCNDTFYRLGLLAASLSLTQFGFLHLPLSDERLPDWITAGALPERCRSLPAETMLRTVLAALGVL